MRISSKSNICKLRMIRIPGTQLATKTKKIFRDFSSRRAESATSQPLKVTHLPLAYKARLQKMVQKSRSRRCLEGNILSGRRAQTLQLRHAHLRHRLNKAERTQSREPGRSKSHARKDNREVGEVRARHANGFRVWSTTATFYTPDRSRYIFLLQSI